MRERGSECHTVQRDGVEAERAIEVTIDLENSRRPRAANHLSSQANASTGMELQCSPHGFGSIGEALRTRTAMADLAAGTKPTYRRCRHERTPAWGIGVRLNVIGRTSDANSTSSDASNDD